MRRAVKLHFASYRKGDQTHSIPATCGELETMPDGATHELSWLLPEGGAQSTLIATEELEYLLHTGQVIIRS